MLKCPSCAERFATGNEVKRHVRDNHNQTIDAMAQDGINHLTPSFRAMDAVLQEECQRHQARIAQLEAALIPFAKIADVWEKDHDYFGDGVPFNASTDVNTYCPKDFTMGDLRRARSLLGA